MARVLGLNANLGDQIRRVGGKPGGARGKRIAATLRDLQTAELLPAPEDTPITVENRPAWARRIPNDHVTVVWYFMRDGVVQVLAIAWTRALFTED